MAIDLFSGDATLLHNPRCSKSRGAKQLLEDRGVAFREHRYLEEPLDANQLRALADCLGKPPGQWIRTKEDAYKAAGLTDDSTDDQIIDAIAANPSLMERPILIIGDRAAIGRPPELILGLLD